MTKPTRSSVAFALVVLALFVGGCGRGDERPSSTPHPAAARSRGRAGCPQNSRFLPSRRETSGEPLAAQLRRLPGDADQAIALRMSRTLSWFILTSRYCLPIMVRTSAGKSCCNACS